MEDRDNTNCPHCGYWSYEPRKTIHEDDKTIVYCCCEECHRWFTIIEHAPVITVVKGLTQTSKEY